MPLKRFYVALGILTVAIALWLAGPFKAISVAGVVLMAIAIVALCWNRRR
jgi:hypothetical protein